MAEEGNTRRLAAILAADVEGYLDLSRFSAAPGAHLSGDLFKSQGAFPA
jgi:hypothetical protein